MTLNLKKWNLSQKSQMTYVKFFVARVKFSRIKPNSY